MGRFMSVIPKLNVIFFFYLNIRLQYLILFYVCLVCFSKTKFYVCGGVAGTGVIIMCATKYNN